jgi:LmbE family N-acetylglucosaminyl deacetylase/predicted ATP-grasp superfamily ATP-dependent carboligase
MTADRASGSAIVVGMSGSTGLAVVRALGQEGVACHAVHYDAHTPAMATRLARTHVAPDWRSDPDGLIDFLGELAGRLGFGGAAVDGGAGGSSEAGGGADGGPAAPGATLRPTASLFVCHDAALGAVWAAAGRLRAAGLRPAFSAVRPLAELLDKRTQLEAAARAGVAAPWTRWGPAAALEAAAAECPYPAILKPAFSHLGVKALGAKALRCADAGELRAALARTGDIELLLQEYVPGGDDQLYTAGLFVCAGGHVAFTGRKLKQHPPGLGIARLAETVDEPGLVPDGVALLAELGYEGISQVEYKRDARDGSFRLMEANFRPWTWMGLATACGTNLPLAAHRWALGDEDWREAGGGARSGRPARRRPAAGHPRPSQRRHPAPRPRRWVWLVPEAAYTARDLRHGVRPRLEQWRGLRAEAFFSRGDPAPLRRTLTAALEPRLRRWTAAARRLRSIVRAALMPAAAVANAGVLRAEWRRAGRRSVAGVAPALGLPAPGLVLVLAPHPDDETLMCGATLAALRRRGDAVRVVCLTSGAATSVGRHPAASAPGAVVPASAPSSSPAPSAAPVAGIGDVRAAELRAACAALGVDDVDLWGFTDGGLPGERDRLAVRLREELDRVRPDLVVVPFPYDAHADHVAVALALADALAARGARAGGGERGAAGGRDGAAGAVDEASDHVTADGRAAPSRVLCGAVRTPLGPCWATRLVPAGGGWTRRRAALRAYASRDAALFATPTLLARLHPAHFARASEGFVELPTEAFVETAHTMEARALTTPAATGGGHPVTMAGKLLRTREERDEVAAVLRAVTTRAS